MAAAPAATRRPRPDPLRRTRPRRLDRQPRPAGPRRRPVPGLPRHGRLRRLRGHRSRAPGHLGRVHARAARSTTGGGPVTPAAQPRAPPPGPDHRPPAGPLTTSRKDRHMSKTSKYQTAFLQYRTAQIKAERMHDGDLTADANRTRQAKARAAARAKLREAIPQRPDGPDPRDAVLGNLTATTADQIAVQGREREKFEALMDRGAHLSQIIARSEEHTSELQSRG